MKLPDTLSEGDTDRNGFLSYAAEWHSFAIGFYDGMKTWRARPGEMPDNKDVQSEPHYYKGAYILGTLLQFFISLVTLYVLGKYQGF